MPSKYGAGLSVQELNRARNAAYRERHREQLRLKCRERRATPEGKAERKAEHRKHTAKMTAAAYRAKNLRGKYKLTEGEYGIILQAQTGACAICREPFGLWRQPQVDHSHVTGRVRGLLCSRCNAMLAFGRDDPDLLARAIRYLGRSVVA